MLGAVLGQPSTGVAGGTATKPKNVTPPTITGTAEVEQKLVATRGTWTGKPTSFHFVWSRCDTDGACLTIAGASKKTYVPTAAGATAAVSAPSAVVSPSGCPPGTATIPAAQLAPPARLDIAAASLSRSVTRATRAIHLRITITACGRPVQGAAVFATAVPYNQFAVGQATTDAAGKATLMEQRLRGFPASPHQRLLAVFVRASKPGDPLLAGVSSRRLVAFRFAHH